MPARKPKPTLTVVTRDRIPFPARRCPSCGGTVIIGAEQFHDCPGPRRGITIADGTRGMERGR
jgi:hypothetical protein